MIFDVQIFGKDYQVRMSLTSYLRTNQPAIQIYDLEGTPMGTLTSALPNEITGTSEFIIKTWSENEWVEQLLFKYSDIFMDTGRRTRTGASVWRIDTGKLVDARECVQ